MPWPKTCLFTAATDDFVPGAFVMVRTFLKHHPCFDGDVVVVHDGLSDASREVLAASFHRLRFEPVSPALRDRVARLCAARPEIDARRASFWFLEAFRPRGYRKVLCCDGDLLFRGAIAELFDSPEALLCCRDQFSLRGLPRDAVTYRPVAETAVPATAPAAAPTLAETFNCGFLLIDGRLTEEAVHADLLAMVSPETWRGVQAVATDQLVLNRYFAGRQTLVSSTFNYPVDCAGIIQDREGVGVEDARVLHFKLPMKPWMPDAMLYWARADAACTFPPGYKLWYDAYVDCLADARLRHVLARPGVAVVPRSLPRSGGRRGGSGPERLGEATPRRGTGAAPGMERTRSSPPAKALDGEGGRPARSPGRATARYARALDGEGGRPAPAESPGDREAAASCRQDAQPPPSSLAGPRERAAGRAGPAGACLVTGTTDDFVPGTLAMLGSFLKHHPRFDGDVVVIHDGLSAASREALAPLSGRLRFDRVSPELKERLARLSAAQPRLRDRLAHFYSLEAFRLHGYRKVLYCDGDLLFRGSIAELFDAGDALICCGDSPHLRGLPRDAVTFLPVPVREASGRAAGKAEAGHPHSGDQRAGAAVAEPEGAGRTEAGHPRSGTRRGTAAGERPTIGRTFNSGLLLIDGGLVREGCYAGLLAMVCEETWRHAEVRIADQLVLNRYFAGRQTLVSSTFNYLIPQADVIRDREGIDLRGAKVLHFRAPFKPWRPEAMLAWAGKEARDAMTPGFKLWYGAYVDCLAGLRLRNALRRARPRPVSEWLPNVCRPAK